MYTDRVNCEQPRLSRSRVKLVVQMSITTREGFLRKKNIVAVSFMFKNCGMHPFSEYISFPLNEIIQAWTSFLFIFIHVH